MTKRTALLIIGLLVLLPGFGQNSDQDKLREAKLFFGHQRYSEALSVLSSSRQLSRFDEEARFLMAVCQYQLNKLDQAQQLLMVLTKEDETPYPECWLYLAKIYHAQHRFKEASDHYKTYLRSVFPNDPNRRMVIEEIRRCANGVEMQFQQTTTVAENLGPGINTDGDEFAPIPSPNYADRLYFSAIRPQNVGGPRDAYGKPDQRWGNNFSDLFSSQVIKGTWNNAVPMHYLLNSPRHEILLGFSFDGLALYYFKGWDLNRGEIVVDTFKRMEERTLSSTPLPVPLEPGKGDNYPVFYRDTLMIFASNRSGGYGGWDLYKCNKKNGQWQAPQNLGPNINSAFDETTPFIANDGQTIYFSTNNSRISMGGLDVCRSVYIPQQDTWLPPVNVGLPVNSAADDAFYKIAQDGFTAYFASSRKDGLGKRDIYAAFYQDFLPEMEYPPNFFDDPQEQQVMPPRPVPPPDPQPVPIPRMEENREEISLNGNTDFESPNSRPIDIPQTAEQKNRAEQPAPPDPVPFDPPVPDDPPAPENSYSPITLDAGGPAVRHFDALDRMSNELIGDSDLKLVITAFNEKTGQTGPSLFAAVQKAEAVAQYLLRKGVRDDQLFMRGVLTMDARQGNKVELAFTSSSGRVPAGLPAIGTNTVGLQNDLLINQPVHYKIQVASAQREIREDYLEDLPDPMIEKTPDFAYYRYTLGAFLDRSEAERFRQRMKANGRTSAFLATYRSGWRMER
jgi:tetratricopeptide (TPR) repeat protein